MKKCGFCSFTGEEPAFTQHMREAHGWSGAKPVRAPAPSGPRALAWWKARSKRTQAILVLVGLFVVYSIVAQPRTAGVAEVSATPPAATAAQSATVAPSTRVRAQVLSVTDGDTIRVSVNGRSTPIRYIGIDTPETVDPRTSVQCFGAEASAANKRLVEGKTVELEKDVSETDKFDRLLRYVYVDGVMVNEELVRGGYAKSSTYPPDVKYQPRFAALEAEARSKGVGLWAAGACAVATTAPVTAPPPGTAFAVTITTSRYGYVAASTSSGASCTAQARLPSGTISADQDLKVTKTASGGAVVWDYGTSSRTNAGTGTHTVTCTLNGMTRSASATFFVQ